MRLDDLDRTELAALVPELLLCGHLIDRSGMPHLISAFGRDGMRDVAIEEWMGASPVYTRRMQRALRFEGDTVETVFKGMQIDVGAPPQFMDFRYLLHGDDSGEFWLDHCGALMDVEPMGDDYVTAMCHDIEDPTFEATAIASNRHVQVRPIHRPPRTPADRQPHCHWTVRIDPSFPELPVPVEAIEIGATRAATLDLDAPDPTDPGRADYTGPLLSDLRFEDWSRSALVRIAEEVCLQGHLLTLSFLRSVRVRTDPAAALDIGRKQFAGIAGLTAERLRLLFDLGGDAEGLAAVLRLHPALGPASYVEAAVSVAGESVELRLPATSPAMEDGAWPALLDVEHLEPLQALARGVDPHWAVTAVRADDGALVVTFTTGAEELPESSEVALTRFSTGADFGFEVRPTPVEIRPS